MATRSKPNWKMLDILLPVLEKEGWSHAQIAEDWGISLATLEGHLTQEVSMLSKHDYAALIEEYDQRRASGESHQAIRATFESRGINWGTFQNRRTQAKKAHQSTPEAHQETPEVHPSRPYEAEVLTAYQDTPEHPSPPERPEIPSDEQSTKEHQGTLEGHQEVIEEVHQSVPDAPHVGAEESIPEHPSTPIVHPKLSPDDSSTAHSGVPARQDHLVSTPMVHLGTPTEEDWQLWTVVKSQWPLVEKLLSDWQTRHTLLSTPSGTPRHTMKKTYVVDSLYVELIDRYAQEQGVELKDVVNLAFREFFERREYLPEDRRVP